MARRKDARVVFFVERNCEEPSCLKVSHLRFPRQVIYDGIRGLWCRMLSEIEESDRGESRCSWAGTADDVIGIPEQPEWRSTEVVWRDAKVIITRETRGSCWLFSFSFLFSDETDSISRYLICSETRLCFPHRFHSIVHFASNGGHDEVDMIDRCELFFIIKGKSRYNLRVW
jgi:hypothetical protein